MLFSLKAPGGGFYFLEMTVNLFIIKLKARRHLGSNLTVDGLLVDKKLNSVKF